MNVQSGVVVEPCGQSSRSGFEIDGTTVCTSDDSESSAELTAKTVLGLPVLTIDRGERCTRVYKALVMILSASLSEGTISTSENRFVYYMEAERLG